MGFGHHKSLSTYNDLESSICRPPRVMPDERTITMPMGVTDLQAPIESKIRSTCERLCLP